MLRISSPARYMLALALSLPGPVAFASSPTRPRATYAPVVLSGAEAPGLPGSYFKSFPRVAVMSDRDDVVFPANTSVADPYDADGIFIADRRGQISLVAARGDAAPGAGDGVTFLEVNFSGLPNASGQLVLEAFLEGPGIDPVGADNTNAKGAWLWTDGRLDLIVRNGTIAPGTGGRHYIHGGNVKLDDAGRVAFTGLVPGATTDDRDAGIFYGVPGDIQPLAIEGMPVPGQVGLLYGDMTWNDLKMNGGGRMAYLAELAGPAATHHYDRGLFVGRPEDPRLIVRSGDRLPGTDAILHDFRDGPVIDREGGVMFSAMTTRDLGLFAGKPETLEPVVFAGAPAPGLPGRILGGFSSMRYADNNHVSFAGSLEPDLPEDSIEPAGLWAGKPGRMSLIAMTGQHLPGTEEGVYLRRLNEHALNGDGQVAFIGYLGGPGARGPNDYGIFATGHAGDLRLIARYGDPFDVAPGDVRVIDAVSSRGIYGDGLPSFNRDGDLVMILKFTDGSEGIFIATVLPEPAAAALAAAAGVLLLRLRPGRRCPSPL